MTLRKFLLIPLAISVILFGIYSNDIVDDVRNILGHNYSTFIAVLLVLCAVFILVMGHLIRAYKLTYIMRPVREVAVKQQFRALAIGYMFNTILPLRIGELVRAQVIASSQSLSYGFTLTMIIIERLVDVIILTLVAALLVGLGVFTHSFTPYLVASGIIAFVVVFGIALLLTENRYVMHFVHRVTQMFNDSIKVTIRFKYWSVMYGVQKALILKRALIFIFLSLLTWMCYGVAVITLLVAIPLSDKRLPGIAAPFYAMSIPLGPANLGSYSKTYSIVTDQPVEGQAKIQALSTWALLVLPMGIVGLYYLMRAKEPVWRKITATRDINALNDKLARNGDISRELSLFLDNYLSGNSLSRIINRLERGKTFRLVKYFKGGSDAITILANEADGIVVKKIIAIDLKNRLKAQYDWLSNYKHPQIVRVLNEHTDDDYYSINLEYDAANEMFFDYIHEHTIDDSKIIMDEVWKTLNSSVHARTKAVVDRDGVRKYIQKHIFDCLDQSVLVSDDLARAIMSEQISINGKYYDNIYTIMDKIMRDDKIMKDIASYRSSGAVHGDVAIDNILVSSKTGKMLLIDPAPDGNIINGPVFDFGKNMQSLYCGYEFLFRGTEKVELSSDGGISFSDKKSLKYTQLCEYVRVHIAPKYLTKAEQRAMLFHAGALHIRRLKHQVYQDPRLTLAMYATGVKTLNEFYDQYSH